MTSVSELVCWILVSFYWNQVNIPSILYFLINCKQHSEKEHQNPTNYWLAEYTRKLLTQRQQTKTKLIDNIKGKLITEEKAIHKRWTEYCMELYKYKLKTDADILKNEERLKTDKQENNNNKQLVTRHMSTNK